MTSTWPGEPGGARRARRPCGSPPAAVPIRNGRRGRLIAYSVRGALIVIAPDGSGRRVVVSPSPEYPLLAHPIWSRDSRTIYYKAYDTQLHKSIWAVPATGGQPRLLVAFDDPARRSLRREFATDGQRFYFTIASDESDIWTLELISK